MTSTFQVARDHPTFNKVLNDLTINHFCKEYGYAESSVIIDPEEIRKAGWIASILANSPEEKHQFRAASFAKLLFLQNPADEQKTQLAYVILSRTGNLAAARHLTSVYEEDEIKTDDKKFKSSFGHALDLEIGIKRNQNRIDIEDRPYFVTDFQRDLWDNLELHDNIAISAPTSAGKSFFVQHFIQGLFEERTEFKVVYIVPTRALISQVSETFRKMLKDDVVVRTAFVDEQQGDEKIKAHFARSKKEIYCVTPERCLKLAEAMATRGKLGRRKMILSMGLFI